MRSSRGTDFPLRVLIWVGAVMTCLPVLWMTLSAFREPADLISDPTGLRIDALTAIPLRDAWRTFGLNRMMFNSLIVCSAITLLTVLSSAYIGYVLHMFRFRLRRTIFWTITLTSMIPVPVLVLPHFQMIAAIRWLDTYTALIMPYAVWGFGVFLYHQSLINLPKDLIDAARLDCASEPAIFLQIALPLTIRSCATIAALTLINQWETLLWPLLVASSADLRLLPSGLAVLAGTGPDLAQYYNPYAAALIASGPLILVTAILPMLLRRR